MRQRAGARTETEKHEHGREDPLELGGEVLRPQRQQLAEGGHSEVALGGHGGLVARAEVREVLQEEAEEAER